VSKRAENFFWRFFYAFDCVCKDFAKVADGLNLNVYRACGSTKKLSLLEKLLSPQDKLPRRGSSGFRKARTSYGMRILRIVSTIAVGNVWFLTATYGYVRQRSVSYGNLWVRSAMFGFLRQSMGTLFGDVRTDRHRSCGFVRQRSCGFVRQRPHWSTTFVWVRSVTSALIDNVRMNTLGNDRVKNIQMPGSSPRLCAVDTVRPSSLNSVWGRWIPFKFAEFRLSEGLSAEVLSVVGLSNCVSALKRTFWEF